MGINPKHFWFACICWLLLLQKGAAASPGTVTIDGSQTIQTINGFGANVHYFAWTNDDLKPVLDAMIDQGGFTIFRVILDNTDWETTNDNNDASVMNWSYYNALYSTPRFEHLWGLLGYLNQRGISNGLMINFQGPGPNWMGQPLTTGLEQEWAEMIASVLIYARTNRGIQFNLVSPDNEPNLNNEGVQVHNANQYVSMLHMLSNKLDTNGLGDVKIVGPDLSYGTTDYMPQMMADPVVMNKLAHFGLHSYAANGVDSSGVYNFINQNGFGDRGFWMTEFNVWCPTCESLVGNFNGWTYCRQTAEYLLANLYNGASAGLVWEGYDSYEATLGPGWSYWGVFGVDDINAVPKTYTVRKDFYTLAQIANYVRPGMQQITVNGSPGSPALQAYFQPVGGQLALVGVNTNSTSRTFSITLASLPQFSGLDLFYTDANTNLSHLAAVPVVNGAFSVTVPADCVFAIAGQQVPPATPALQYLMTTNGAITLAWDLSVTNFTVETTTNTFSPFTWSPMTNAPQSNGGQMQISVPPAAAEQFFRLRWP